MAVCLVVVLKAEEVEVARSIVCESFVIKEGELNVKVASCVSVLCVRIEMLTRAENIVRNV